MVPFNRENIPEQICEVTHVQVFNRKILFFGVIPWWTPLTESGNPSHCWKHINVDKPLYIAMGIVCKKWFLSFKIKSLTGQIIMICFVSKTLLKYLCEVVKFIVKGGHSTKISDYAAFRWFSDIMLVVGKLDVMRI